MKSLAEHLRDLDEATRPGRWSYTRDGDALYLNNGSFGIAAAFYTPETEAEFALIVALRDALPTLLASSRVLGREKRVAATG